MTLTITYRFERIEQKSNEYKKDFQHWLERFFSCPVWVCSISIEPFHESQQFSGLSALYYMFFSHWKDLKGVCESHIASIFPLPIISQVDINLWYFSFQFFPWGEYKGFLKEAYSYISFLWIQITRILDDSALQLLSEYLHFIMVDQKLYKYFFILIDLAFFSSVYDDLTSFLKCSPLESSLI